MCPCSAEAHVCFLTLGHLDTWLGRMSCLKQRSSHHEGRGREVGASVREETPELQAGRRELSLLGRL